MSGVGQETSGVSQHTDKVSEASKIGQGNHLFGHASLVIVKPPRAALLNLAGKPFLETADDGADSGIVIGI